MITAQEGGLYEYTETTSVVVDTWNEYTLLTIFTDGFNSCSYAVYFTPELGETGSYAVSIGAETDFSWYYQNHTLTVAASPKYIITTSPGLNVNTYEVYYYQVDDGFDEESYSSSDRAGYTSTAPS